MRKIIAIAALVFTTSSMALTEYEAANCMESVKHTAEVQDAIKNLKATTDAIGVGAFRQLQAKMVELSSEATTCDIIVKSFIKAGEKSKEVLAAQAVLDNKINEFKKGDFLTIEEE